MSKPTDENLETEIKYSLIFPEGDMGIIELETGILKEMDMARDFLL